MGTSPISQTAFGLIHYLLISSIVTNGQDYGHENKKVVCPSVCNAMACGMGILTCSESGLTELPKTLPPNTSKVLLINQDFSRSSTLSQYNFTEYTAPSPNISKITIQNCSLTEIHQNTFGMLTHLETLDLSFNKLKQIHVRTFAGLRLNFLRLDGNKGVQLSSLSFQGLEVTSLSLIDCELTEISYVIFDPISANLKRLMLSKNRLKTLESKFDPFFHGLEQIGLEENHFDCDQCSLHWLIGSMKSKLIRNPNTQKVMFPRCYQPLRLKNRFIHNLGPDDLECPRPTVHIISILILPNNSATLTCTASDRQSQVVWSQLYSTNNTMPYIGRNILLSESVHSNNLLVQQRQLIDVFSCTVTSPLGNRSSTKLQISWPKLNDRLKPTPESKEESWKSFVTRPSRDSSTKTYFFQPQFSLIEMIAGVIGTFIATLILFVAMLRCIFYRMKFFNKTSQLRDHQLSLTSSKKGKMKPYVTYDPPLYSDSQTYDVPGLSPNVNQSSLGHFIDFKTQQTLYDRNNK